MHPRFMLLVALFITFSLTSLPTLADAGPSSPARGEGPGEGQGPWDRVILRGVNLIRGNGAPAQGPIDIVIEDNRIVRIVSVGHPGVPIKTAQRPKADDNTHEIDLQGHYVLPGFIDMHGHIGGSADNIPAEYVFKLWMAHGVTTVREPGSFNGLDWVLDHVKRSEQNSIVAPRIIPYLGFGMGNNSPISTAVQATKWVKKAKKEGAHGIKFFGANPVIMQAAFNEAKKQDMGTMMHHAQLAVVGMNVLDSARLGLGSMEHWYGLPEAMFEDKIIQHYPADYNYNDEQDRFAEAGKLWAQSAEQGSEKWQQVRDELIALDFTINPTLNIYEASRDLSAQRFAPWHDEYTLPTLWDFFKPSRYAHGSYWFDWTTAHEIEWKRNFSKWMAFLNDYKNHGGRVTVGTDSGYIYKIYGFGYVQEMELLQEAGFHPLEVIQAATLNGAQALGMEQSIGSVEVGKLADLVITEYNPLQNFKTLYGIGHYRLDENNQPVNVGGVRYTMKDGILYDAKAMLEDVRSMVEEAKLQPKP